MEESEEERFQTLAARKTTDYISHVIRSLYDLANYQINISKHQMLQRCRSKRRAAITALGDLRTQLTYDNIEYIYDQTFQDLAFTVQNAFNNLERTIEDQDEWTPHSSYMAISIGISAALGVLERCRNGVDGITFDYDLRERRRRTYMTGKEDIRRFGEKAKEIVDSVCNGTRDFLEEVVNIGEMIAVTNVLIVLGRTNPNESELVRDSVNRAFNIFRRALQGTMNGTKSVLRNTIDAATESALLVLDAAETAHLGITANRREKPKREPVNVPRNHVRKGVFIGVGPGGAAGGYIGANLGALGGPVGMVAGAVIGTTLGLFSGGVIGAIAGASASGQ